MRIRPGIELGNLTDVGCQREDNQDSYGYAEPEKDEEFLKKGRLVMIADGMGGHKGGNIASGIAIDVIRSSYLSSASEDTEAALAEAFNTAHDAIRNFAREHPEVEGMGTTCTVAVLREGNLYYAHVGDSRLYLLRDSQITRITRDHTVTERMVQEGLLREEEAKDHPNSHVLTAAMGIDESLAAEFPSAPIPLLRDDILLLCTDGLHDLVSDGEFGTLAPQGAPGAACKQLIETAKSRGGHDNITVQIVKVTS